MQYTVSEEDKADTQASMISDVGGQLGLWLGCSMLTIVEIIYCCFISLPRRGLQSMGVMKPKSASGGSGEKNNGVQFGPATGKPVNTLQLATSVG